MPAIEHEGVEEQQAPSTEQEISRVGESRRRPIILTAVLTAVVVIAALVIAGVTLLGGGGAKPAASAGVAAAQRPAARHAAATVTPAARIGVTLKEFTVKPAPTLGRAGKVTFAVRNAGAVPHEFVVLRTPKAAADLLRGSEADETGNVGEIGDVQPGEAKTLKLKLTPGHYALICNLPGHYSAGQHADFTVK